MGWRGGTSTPGTDGDPEAIAGMFAEGGTFSDPAAGPGLVGPAIAGYARTLFTGFPDLSFDIQPRTDRLRRAISELSHHSPRIDLGVTRMGTE